MKKLLKWDNIKDYVYIIIAVVLIRTFLVTPAIVNGPSMDNTLKDGQLVIINKLIYRIDDIERFDVVVVKNKADKDKIIKRVIALPNETIEFKNDRLFVNGDLLITDFKAGHTEDFIYTTGDDEYFVMGDNRTVSKDSRYLGTFSKKDIIGRVSIRLFPFNKIGKIK